MPMSITKQQFLEIYKGLPICDKVDLLYSKPTTEQELYTKYLPSKIWRLNNIYTIVNKQGKQVTFSMNLSQHKTYAASLRHSRVIILKSRQQGISTLWLVSFFDDAITIKNFSIGLMAQGQDEASTLLDRTKMLWDELHPDYKQAFDGVAITKDNSKEYGFNNKSNIFIRTSFRSTTLQRLHISEMGKIANKYPEKAQETRTGTLQAIAQGNTAIIESTAEGDNLFKSMWDNAVTNINVLTKKDFLPVFLSWIDDPDCVIDQDQDISDKQAKYFAKIEHALNIKLTKQQKNFWCAQYRELGDKIYQEYPSTPTEAFMSTKQGAYYAEMYMDFVMRYNREVEKLYDKHIDVQMSVDLGMNDTNVLNVFQEYDHSFRIIDEFWDNNQMIKYYTDWVKDQPWFPNLTHVILPHDAEVKESTSGKKRHEVWEEELSKDKDGNPTHITFTILERTDKLEGIEQVRQIIPILWIDRACTYLRSCLLNYRKEYDEKRETFKKTPEHDEYSNGADAIRYMAVGAERGAMRRKPALSEVARKYRARRAAAGHDV